MTCRNQGVSLTCLKASPLPTELKLNRYSISCVDQQFLKEDSEVWEVHFNFNRANKCVHQITILMQLASCDKRAKRTSKLTIRWVTGGEIDTDVVCVAVWETKAFWRPTTTLFKKQTRQPSNQERSLINNSNDMICCSVLSPHLKYKLKINQWEKSNSKKIKSFIPSGDIDRQT